jgi:hypothetical protein
MLFTHDPWLSRVLVRTGFDSLRLDPLRLLKSAFTLDRFTTALI